MNATITYWRRCWAKWALSLIHIYDQTFTPCYDLTGNANPALAVQVLEQYKDLVDTADDKEMCIRDRDTTANQQWDLANPCRKIRLRMAVAGSASNSAAGDTTVYLNSYTCLLYTSV